MIISVHIPKTAGTSFRLSLLKAFENQILIDYDYQPANTLRLKVKEFILNHSGSPLSRLILNRQYKIIHGHFPAGKYKNVSSDVKFAAFFRDPIDRVASHYFFYQRHANKEGFMSDPLCRKILEGNLSLKEYAQLQEMSNFYKIWLTDSVTVDDFYFVGLTEAYEDSIKLFNKMFDVELDFVVSNKGTINNYYSLIEEMGMLLEVKESQKQNQLVYDQARRKFEKLCQKYL